MSPDEEHTKYFMEHKNGNHPEGEPAGETVRFMERQNEFNEKIGGDVTEIKLVVGRIEGKLDYTNGKVGEQEKFKNSYEQLLKTLVEEKATKKSNVNALIWKIVEVLVIGVVASICLKYGFKII